MLRQIEALKEARQEAEGMRQEARRLEGELEVKDSGPIHAPAHAHIVSAQLSHSQ